MAEGDTVSLPCVGADERVEPPRRRLEDRRPAAGVEIIVGLAPAAGPQEHAPVIQELHVAADEIPVVELQPVAVVGQVEIREQHGSPEPLLRIGLLEVEAAGDVGLVVAAEKEADVVVLECVVEIVVMPEEADVLAVVVEIRDGAEAGFHYAVDRRASAAQLAAPAVLVAAPPQ